MRAVGAALLLMLAVAGCDWREFDQIQKNTPVVAISPPSNYPASNDFGPILVPLAPPADGSSAGRFVATATHTTSVAVVSFAAAGNPGSVGVSGPQFDLLQQGPVNAVAPVPGGRQVLLGAPYIDRGDALLMNVDEPYTTTHFQNIGEPLYGVGVGAGTIGGGAAPELVVLSTTTLHVYVDSDPLSQQTYPPAGPSDPCSISLSAALPELDRVNRPVIVAPLQGGAAQVAVGTPAQTGAGNVSIFNVDVAAGTITCAAMLTAAESRFGQSMTLVDIDGDGTTPDHLLVGAPPTHAYLYSLPLSTGQAPSATATDMMAGGRFGAAVAAFDIDGRPGDEVFVGNPDGTVGTTTTAGRVSIYTGPTLALVPPTTIPNPLAEHELGAGHGYGSGIAGMTFCPGNVASADGGAPAGDGGIAPCTKLPIIGSLSKVFAYFTLKKPDPRVK